MDCDLRKIRMERGQHYETIISSIDKEGKINTAPFGVLCAGRNKIMCRIFDGGTTIANIRESGEFVVNITDNPLFFTLATLETIPEDYISMMDCGLPYITDADAYFRCKVDLIRKAIRKNDPIKPIERNIIKTNFIKSDVLEIHINNPCVKPINRGMHVLIEALVNYDRIEIVDKKMQDYYVFRFREARRIIKKVGSKDEKKAIGLIIDGLNKKGDYGI